MISEENPDLRVTVAEAGDLLEDPGSYDRIVVPACIAEGHIMDRDVYVHTPSQGAVAVFCRKGDEIQGIRSLNHMPTRTEVEAERGIMNLIGAVPDAPIGIDAEIECDCIRIRAVSRCYTDESRRVDEYIPIDYVMDEILGIAEFLAGRRDSLRQRLNTIPVIFDTWNAQRAMRIR